MGAKLRQLYHVRHQRRDLSGSHRRHEPMEIRACRQNRLRTLEEAMKGATCFLGVSVKGAVTPAMVASMADNPVIFAMANPDPEITPEEAHEVRADAIVATGRSRLSQPGEQRLGFPYLFRGALDIQCPRHQRRDEDRLRPCAWPIWRAKMCRTRSRWPMVKT